MFRFLGSVSFLALFSCATGNESKRSSRAQPYYELGFSAYADKEYPKAISFFQKALDMDSRDRESEMMLGLSYLEIFQTARALEIVKSACARDPQWAHCHNNLAYVLIVNKMYREALVEVEKAIAIPTFSDLHLAYVNKGHALTELKNYSEALKALQRAKEFNTQHCRTRLHLGRVYILKSDLRSGSQEIQFAISKCPQEALFHLWEAYVLALQGHQRQSFEKLRFIQQRFPRSLAMEEATRFMDLIKNEIPLPEPPLN